MTLAGLAAALAVAGLAGAVSLQKNTDAGDADFHATGAFGDQLPSAVSAGDWNGDGYGDLLMCASTNNSCSISLGRPTSIGAGLGNARPEVVLLGPGGAFGFAAAFVGDVNGDGYEDVVVGAPWLVGATAQTNSGSAWLFFGRNDAVGASVTLGYYQANVHVLGTERNGTLGSAAVGAGDLDRDGKAEFWLCAGRIASPSTTSGSLYLFSGRSTWPSEVSVSDAILTLDNVTASANARPALLGGIDLDGDTRLDLAVGSDMYPNLAGDRVGAVFIFLNPYGKVGQVLGPSAADVVVRGTLNISHMGSALAFAPDFTLGALPTLMVSADYNSTNVSAGGAVYLYRTTGWACCRTLFGWDASGLLYSPDEGDVGGYSLGTGDIDGDGWTDLVIGAIYAKVGASPSPGTLYLFYGRETGTTPTALRNATGWVNGPRPYCMLGTTLAVTDFNRDGKADFFAGCPLSYNFQYTPGDVYGFLGRPRNRAPFVTITGPSSATEGDNVTIGVTVLDPDRDHLTWYFQRDGIPGGLAEHQNAPEFTYTVADEGDTSWTVVVNDGEFSVSTVWRFSSSNAAPSCRFEVDAPIEEGKNRSIRVVGWDPGAADIPGLNYTWSGPANMTVNASTAWYRPPRGQPFLVRVDVRDPDGGFGSCVWNVPVINAEPRIDISAPGEVFEGSVVGLYADVSDNGTEDVVTVEWRSPEGVVIEGAIVNWVPQHPGVFHFNVSARDLDGAVVYANHTVRVRAVVPDVTLSVAANATEGELVELVVTQNTGDAFDPITVSWHVCNHPLGTGLTYTLLRADPGSFCVEALVIDDDGQWVQLRGWLEVLDRPPLDGVIVTPPDTYLEGSLVTFDVRLAEWETSDLTHINVTWRVDGRVAGYGSSFYWKALSGSHEIKATARDPQGAQSDVVYAIDVINVPPTVYIIGPSTLQPGVVEEWQAFAGDPSGIPVEIDWQVDGVPVARGEKVHWGTTAGGDHTLTATAKDASGETSTAVFHVVVAGGGELAGVDLGWVPYALTASVAFTVGIYAGRLFATPSRDPQTVGRRRGGP